MYCAFCLHLVSTLPISPLTLFCFQYSLHFGSLHHTIVTQNILSILNKVNPVIMLKKEKKNKAVMLWYNISILLPYDIILHLLMLLFTKALNISILTPPWPSCKSTKTIVVVTCLCSITEPICRLISPTEDILSLLVSNCGNWLKVCVSNVCVSNCFSNCA